MSHAVNPTGFRSGKQNHFWSHNAVAAVNNKQSAQGNDVNLSLGLEATANNLLRRNNYWTVKSTTKFDTTSGITKLNVLYYPLVAPILRKRLFPTYCAPRNLLSKPASYTNPFKKVMAKVWSSKNRAFNNRFIRAKPRVNLNKMVMKAMFRGTKLFRGLKPNVHKKTKSLFSKYLANKFVNYNVKANRWARWRMSTHRVNSRLLSKQLSKRVGTRVQVKAMNAFTYLLKKTKAINFGTAQQRIWNKRYHFHKRRFAAYYDIVNSLFLLSHVPFAEKLLVRMIQYGLAKMHRRKIRPKNFFYFINTVVKNMPEIKKNFNAFRIVITGKLRGGTSRTTQFSAGFGVIPLQTIEENIHYEFGNVRSKYGSFGVKLYTWRKSSTMQLKNREMGWASYFKTGKSRGVVIKARRIKKAKKKLVANKPKNKLKFKKVQAIRKFYYAYIKVLEISAAIKENKINIAKFIKIFKRSRYKLSKQSQLIVRSKINQLKTNNAELKLNKHSNSKVLVKYRQRLSRYYIVKIRLAALKNVEPSKEAVVELSRTKLTERQLKKLNNIKLKRNIVKKAKLDKRRRRAYWQKRYGNVFIKGKKRFGKKNSHFNKRSKNKRYPISSNKRFTSHNKNQNYFNNQSKVKPVFNSNINNRSNKVTYQSKVKPSSSNKKNNKRFNNVLLTQPIKVSRAIKGIVTKK